jgi:glucokinase
MNTFLVGDLGGTNSRFALFSAEAGTVCLTHEQWEKSNSLASFEALLEKISAFDPKRCKVAVLAVPGPVTQADTLAFPHVQWTLSRTRLNKRYPDTKFFFINDFAAQAYGCLTEAVATARPLICTAQPQEDIAIVGAGTGLGHGTLRKTAAGDYLHIPSEAGQIPFPFAAEGFEQRFRAFLVQISGQLSPVADAVISGKGLAHLHHFLTGQALLPHEVAAAIDARSETTRHFARFYARACKHYVLSTLAAGGRLFLSGGVAMKNPFLVDNAVFRQEFGEGSETAQRVLHQISVALVQNERIGLFGAAFYAAQQHPESQGL